MECAVKHFGKPFSVVAGQPQRIDGHSSKATRVSSILELRIRHISRWALAHGLKPDANAFRLILEPPSLSVEKAPGQLIALGFVGRLGG